jgi:homotetrameric cytidine deaminase
MSNWQTLLQRSYVPYSGKAGAALCIGISGVAYPGIRIENISFPLTIDEVQGALYHCISQNDTPAKVIIPNNDLPLLDFWEKEFDITVEVQETIDADLAAPDQLDPDQESQAQITQILKDLSGRAQVAFSNFPVSAVLTFADSSQYITGVNIETEDWRLGLCAERVAISNALSLGLTDFKSIHIYTPKADFSSPCGACRQVINEHLPQADAIMHYSHGDITRLPAHQYLPYAFRASSLIKN